MDTRSAIKQYTNKFGVRDIAITYIHADNNFKTSRDIIIPIYLEVSEKVKHVGDIKIEVRTLKGTISLHNGICTTQVYAKENDHGKPGRQGSLA